MTNSKNHSLARRGLDLVMSGDPANQERGNQLITDALEQEPGAVEHLRDRIKAESATADGHYRPPGAGSPAALIEQESGPGGSGDHA
jgi:hypothetical protein